MLSCGDSFSVGDDLEIEIGYNLRNIDTTNEIQHQVDEYRDAHNFCRLVANNFNLNLINIAEVGASNEYIIYSVIDYIKNNLNNLPEFVLINLSSPSRFLYYLKNEERPLFINFLHYDNHIDSIFKKTDDYDKLKTWYNVYEKYFINDFNIIKKQKYLIEYLKLLLESKSIKYIFTPTFKLDFNLSSITDNSIDVSMIEYLEQKNIYRPEGLHFLSDGHIEWGNYISSYIIDNNLL